MIADQVQNNTPAKISMNPRYVRGAVLLILGFVFLLKNYGAEIPLPEHWWAGLLFLAGCGYLFVAWRHYASGTEPVRKYLRAGLALIIVGVVFSFQLDMGKLWPVFLIAAGISALLLPRRKNHL